MISRERIKKAIAHKDTDKLPVDFGGSFSTGIHASTLYKLRQYYSLDKPGTPVKLYEPFMGLGIIDDDLMSIIGSDVKILTTPKSAFFGFENENWKEWKYDDGTPVLVPEFFNTDKNIDGSLFQYPQGDKKCAPCAVLPKNGYYFDAMARQEEIDYNYLDPEDNIEEFGLISDEEIRYIKKKVLEIYNDSEYSIFNMVSTSSFGDEAEIPGMSLKYPKGIRSFVDWYIAVKNNKDYIKRVFDYQCDIAIDNFRRIHNVAGDMIDVCSVSGTDFGTQSSLMISIETFRNLYKPYLKKINNWIHSNTQWKTFIHSCGSIYDLMPEFIETGFDICNPVQISANHMDPLILKKEFGKYITFWGGAINAQKTLPFGTPKEVGNELRRNIDIFSKDGGFVLANIHNLQPGIPVDNIIEMIKVINEHR